MSLSEELEALRSDMQVIHDSQIRLETTLTAMQPVCAKRFSNLEITVFGKDHSNGLKSDMTRLKTWMWLGAGACTLAGTLTGTVIGFLLEKCFG